MQFANGSDLQMVSYSSRMYDWDSKRSASSKRDLAV
jgi:hypothetical protein